MFLMWIFALVLAGLIVYAISGNNLVNAFKPAINRTCPRCAQAVQNAWKTARTADNRYERNLKMKRVNWWIVGIVAVLAALFLFGGGMTLGPGASAGVWGNRGYGMMGGPGMRGNWGLSPLAGLEWDSA
jgi:lysozyme family protein